MPCPSNQHRGDHGRGTNDIVSLMWDQNNAFRGICFFGWETKIDFKDIALLLLLVEDLEGRRRGPWLSCRSRRGASTASTSARPPDHELQDGKGEENGRAKALNNVRGNKA